MINFIAGIPATKHARGVTSTPTAPNLESISLSQAQIANPEMLFKVNNTAKYVHILLQINLFNKFIFRHVRVKLGRPTLLKSARSPFKTVKFDERKT